MDLAAEALLLFFLGALGAGDIKADKEGIQVNGRIYVMGNEPFTQVAIQMMMARFMH